MEDNMIIELYFSRDERAIQETSEKYGSYLLKIANNILNQNESSEERKTKWENRVRYFVDANVLSLT